MGFGGGFGRSGVRAGEEFRSVVTVGGGEVGE